MRERATRFIKTILVSALFLLLFLIWNIITSIRFLKGIFNNLYEKLKTIKVWEENFIAIVSSKDCKMTGDEFGEV